MQEHQIKYYYPSDEPDEELTINLKKIALAVWSRKALIIKVFAVIFSVIVLSTFITAKKYKVDADLYINKTNSSNMAEINPYFISEAGGGMMTMLAGSQNLTNELELMQSPLVIDKVIQENNLRVKKLFGIIKTKKYGQYVKADKFVKKLSIEIKKGTNVVSISYKSKDKDLAYGVVNSIITNYIQLRKELNTEKAKSDIAVLQAEYDSAKANLNQKINSVSGMPASSITGSGNITAMSAFSKSAQKAMGGIQSQYVRGVKSEIALREDAEKVAELAKKLEWAKLVDNMGDTSNVVILKEPQHLKDYEQVSPKLFTNILLGIVFGVIASLLAVIFKEITDEKLAFSMLGDDIIYNIERDYIDLKATLLANKNISVSLVVFEGIDDTIIKQLQQFKNINFVKADITEEFENGIENSEKIVIIAKIGKTNSRLYKRIKQLLTRINKKILTEVLV